MKYLGLDLSTVSTGYSVFNDSKLVEYGKIVSILTDTMERIMEITGRLAKIVEQHKPDVIVIEDVFYGSNYLTTKMLNRLAGAVWHMLYESKFYINEYQNQKITFAMPTDARKCFGLLPKSTKINVINAVNARFQLNLTTKDDDVADGVVLGYAGYYKETNPDAVFKKSEQQFFKTKVRGIKTPPIKGQKPRQ